MEWLQIDLMARLFIVEREAFACMADRHHATIDGNAGHRAGGAGWRLPSWQYRRAIGMLREGVQDIDDKQFLVLLLVLQAKFQAVLDLGGQAVRQPADRSIHMRAIRADRIRRRPAQQPAHRARMPVADCLVIGIEQIAEGGIERTVIRQIRPQDELLEEPRRMGAMPFGRAGIRHPLQTLVFRRQRGHQCFRRSRTR